ncbi:MAG: EamA family transporter, partial [Firmicutes bacterium]|nr:EamA family transporter [Bacillota bacterium]
LAIWRNGRHVLALIVFAIVGLLGVQYTYFVAIQAGNAAAATLLQYMAPVMITAYTIWRARRHPTVKEVSAVILAVGGTALLVTDGQAHLSISTVALIWGIISALSLAFYTVFPMQLLRTYGAQVLMSWAMVLAGIVMAAGVPHPLARVDVSWGTWGIVTFVVIGGTLMAFVLFMTSLRDLMPHEASLLATIEPLTATAATVVWLHVHFGGWALLGAGAVLGTVLILALPPGNPSSWKKTRSIG